MRQNKTLWYKWIMFEAVLCPHHSMMFIHVVLPCNLCCLRPMINLLKSVHSLVNHRFDVATSPHYAPFLFAVRYFAEAIVFEGIPYQPDLYIIIKLEVQPFVLWLVRPNCHRINVWSKHHVLLETFALNSWHHHLPLLICFIQLAGHGD